MTRMLDLERFDAEAAGGATGGPAARGDAETPATTDAALAAFDEGYRDGWDDCARAEAERNRSIGADLAANLRELARGQEAARRDVLAGLGPFFEELAARFLPDLAAEAVGPVVLSELGAVADRASRARPVLVASPAALPALEHLLDSQGVAEVELRAEPAYADGQVSLRFEAERRDIDLGDAARRVAEAIRAFVETGPDAVTPAAPWAAGDTAATPGSDAAQGAA
jgi:flagellar assembly protein FliH